MEIFDLIGCAQTGAFPPFVAITGAERFLVERAVRVLRTASIGDGPRGFNDDVFHGRGLRAETILSAAKTLPMMAPHRFVLVRDAEAIDSKEHDAILAYAKSPAPETCLVLTGQKFDGRGKLVKSLKRMKLFVEAKELKGAAIRSFVSQEAKARGHRLAGPAATALVEAVGSDLALLDDALERLSLFVGGTDGSGNEIDLASVEACITRVRTDSIWALVDAVSKRDQKTAVAAAASLLADREQPLRISAMVARQLRMVAKMRQALRAGMNPKDACKAAGVPPFKAREMASAAKQFSGADLQRAFRCLAETDLMLKGAKRPGPLVLEEALIRLCGGGPALVMGNRPGGLFQRLP
ncbi:MAG: DNA polymerase III subunit delta [Myxococcota bacterium]